ncbi:helix-turn-helix domain-containing protein, partial [Nostoc sp. CHAB 5784]|uniref:helix-turn-helix domain-containing protein n=1 Tax=Nostoc mirabile TaxID=2907820 RepID=UPI001E3DD96F
MSLAEKIQSDASSYGRRKRHIYIDSKLDDLPLTMEAFRVYSHLCRRAGCDNNAFPSYKSIGEACFRGSFPGSSTETLRQKAIAAVSELVSWNLITKTSITKSNGSVSNGTKKSSKLYGIRATALKVIEQSRRGQAVVLDAVSWKRSPQ